jgi:hypothetical protein
MKPEDIDSILSQPTVHQASQEASDSMVARARQALLADLRPAPPMAPAWVFTLTLTAIFSAMAVTAASVLGLHGWHAQSTLQTTVLLFALLAAALGAAASSAREMRPAAGPHRGGLALLFALALFAAIFGLMLSGYSLASFVPEGLPCLRAGMAVSIPTGVLIAWVLRRGFVLSWANAGLAAGTLSGLAGLGMLELHCPNLKAVHNLTWHLAVVALSAALGLLAGFVADRRRFR